MNSELLVNGSRGKVDSRGIHWLLVGDLFPRLAALNLCGQHQHLALVHFPVDIIRKVMLYYRRLGGSARSCERGEAEI